MPIPAGDTGMELAVALREEARRSNQRRVLVLAGDSERCRSQAVAALEATAIPPGETTYIGPSERFHCESLAHHEIDQLLGTSREAVIYDCYDRCEPNALGKLVGTVSGGGLFVLLTPPLSEWPSYRDGFDSSLAVPPFEQADVDTNFRRRLIETLRSHRGVAIVDVDSDAVECDGLFDPPPSRPQPEPTPPASGQFPRVAYEHCRTQDQAAAVSALEALSEKGEGVVIEANRGRGKSSAAGIAAACLAHEGKDVLVTAPAYDNTATLFERAREVLAALDSDWRSASDRDHSLETATGRIRYEKPVTAARLPESPDVVIVDEAAALPVRLLRAFLSAESVAFTTTIHGYEGAGRGFSVRFREHLATSRFAVTDVSLATPIRYAPGDPVEVWSFRALALNASPPAEELVSGASPETVQYRRVSGTELCDDDNLLSEVFGLLVLAHYRTEPNDLARLLDAPNISVHCLTHEGHVVAVALTSREGELPPERRRRIYEGERIRGNLLPDVLTSQLRDESAGELRGLRIMRIATHTAVRSRGLGSALLGRIREWASDSEMDWLGVAYGVTPRLATFWNENDFSTIHLSTTRNARSGEHSALMLDPLTTAGKALHERHTAWFLQRTPAAIRQSLSDVDPAVVRAACRSADGTPTLDLTDDEWRHAAGMGYGKAIFETAPRGPQRLCFRHLVAPAEPVLTPDEQSLLVRVGVQGQPWETVTEAEDFHTESEAMRTMGEVVGKLVELYGDATARAEIQRYEKKNRGEDE